MTSLAVLNFQQYRDRYPYDGAAVRRMPPEVASLEMDRFGVSSVDALALVADLVEARMLENEKALVGSLGDYAGRDLSAIDVQHVFIDTPNAITLYDPNDDSYAIGIDPGVWQALAALYLDAAMAHRVDDPRLFLVLATRTVGWFWTGSENWAQDLDGFSAFAKANTPDLWSLAQEVVRTSIAFTVAHEVGHIVLGHLTGGHAGRVEVGDAGASLASALDHEAEEYAADDWAADALFAVASGDFKEQTLALTVPALSFSLAALAADMREPATNEIAVALAGTHPPNVDRARNLHVRAGEHAHEVAGSDAMKHFVELGLWVNDQRLLLEREGMQWAPEWLRAKGLG